MCMCNLRTKYTRLQKSGGACTVCAYYSGDEIRVTRTERCPSLTHKNVYLKSKEYTLSLTHI